MQKVIFDRIGEPLDVLRVEEVDMPSPAGGEVLIRVEAMNINPADIMFIRGMYGIQPNLPSGAGFEAVGTVVDPNGSSRFETGQRVLFSTTGTWAEYVCLADTHLIKVPVTVPNEIACQAFINPITAYGMLAKASLNSGDWLLLTAGNSAFSKLVIQMAVPRGIQVICTVRQQDQVEPLMEMGVKAVVADYQQLRKSVMDLTGGKGAHAAFDAVGGTLGAEVINCLGRKGTMVVYGLLSLQPIPVNSGILIFKDIVIEGFWLSSYLTELPADERENALKTVLQMIAQRSIQLDVGATFPLSRVKDAIAAFEKPGRSGKIILTRQ